MNPAPPPDFRLALVQMRVAGGRKKENLDHACFLIGEAAGAGASLVVLPEAMTLGWTDRAARTDADEIPEGDSCQALIAAAKRHRVFVCSGLIEKAKLDRFNSAVLISPDGEVLIQYRKLNELDFAHDLYGLGDRLAVAHTPLGTIGLMICADGFATGQVIARTLGYMGADIILSPSAWAVPADHDDIKEPYGTLWLENYAPVARDFQLWIAGVSNVGWITDGPWQGRKCIGCSLVVNPEGRSVLRGPYGADAETILFVNIVPARRPARGTQWADRFKTDSRRQFPGR